MEEEAKDNCSTFFLFLNLPTELRDQIWHDALDHDVGLALYAYKKGCWCPRWLSTFEEQFDPEHPEYNLCFEFRYSLLHEARMEVPVAFVNREAQDNAITWAQKQSPRIRTCLDGHQLVFLRAFNPDRDAVYVAPDQWLDLIREPTERMFASDMLNRPIDLRHGRIRIAMPESLVRDKAAELSELVHSYYHPIMLYIVVDTPPNLGLLTTPNGTTQRLCECRSSHRVALWTSGGDWEFDFTDGRCGGNEFRELVELASQGLREGLVTMMVPEFEIHAVSVAGKQKMGKD
ncbi:hypothetical protein F4818DRAFT_379344 [Hypoxylon cercidicola]|nr:hypothetical protein F4818DRAFT_379344 [Hypoxylon cercidicola]